MNDSLLVITLHEIIADVPWDPIYENHTVASLRYTIDNNEPEMHLQIADARFNEIREPLAQLVEYCTGIKATAHPSSITYTTLAEALINAANKFYDKSEKESHFE